MPSKPPSPQERALKTLRSLYVRDGLSPEEIERKLKENASLTLFDRLSDDEWVRVWRHVADLTSANESRVRVRVDFAAYSSGCLGEQDPPNSVSECRKWLEANVALLAETKRFRSAFLNVFGTDPDYKLIFNAHPSVMLPLLREIEEWVNSTLLQKDRFLRGACPNPPNAAKLKRDLWMANLVTVWRDECKLTITNCKRLRSFLLDAIRPYVCRSEPTILTDRMAKYFIDRWLKGEVKEEPACPFGPFSLEEMVRSMSWRESLLRTTLVKEVSLSQVEDHGDKLNGC